MDICKLYHHGHFVLSDCAAKRFNFILCAVGDQIKIMGFVSLTSYMKHEKLREFKVGLFAEYLNQWEADYI